MGDTKFDSCCSLSIEFCCDSSIDFCPVSTTEQNSSCIDVESVLTIGGGGGSKSR